MGPSTLLIALIATTAATSALAGAHCEGPEQDGNTWNLYCSADGEGEGDYNCDYFLSVTNSQGSSDVVEASGSVGAGQTGMILWSAIQNGGSDIVSASIQSGSCIAE